MHGSVPSLSKTPSSMSTLRTAILRKPKADGRDHLRVDGVGASLMRILDIGLPSAAEVGTADVKLSVGVFFGRSWLV